MEGHTRYCPSDPWSVCRCIYVIRTVNEIGEIFTWTRQTRVNIGECFLIEYEFIIISNNDYVLTIFRYFKILNE